MTTVPAPSSATSDRAESPLAATLPIQATAQAPAASPDQAQGLAGLDLQSFTAEVTRLLDSELRRRGSGEPVASSQGTSAQPMQSSLAAAEPAVGEANSSKRQKESDGTPQSPGSGSGGTSDVVVPTAPAPAPTGRRRRSKSHGASPIQSPGALPCFSVDSFEHVAVSYSRKIPSVPQRAFGYQSPGIQVPRGPFSPFKVVHWT